MLIIHIPLDMKVAFHANGSIVAKLEKTATLMHKPKLTRWCHGWHLLIRKAPANDNALLHIPFLGNEEHLVAWIGWADHSPATSHPLW
jgi:hypothetical protein